MHGRRGTAGHGERHPDGAGAPSGTPTGVCGSWATDPRNSTARAIARAAGPVAYCRLFGSTWVILTAGIAHPPGAEPNEPPPPGATYLVRGAVLTDACAPADPACLDPSRPHPFRSWDLTRFPGAGYAQLAALLTPTVFVAIATFGQLMFNTATRTWFRRPSSALVTCEREWGAYDSAHAGTLESSLLSPSVERAFIDAHPGCTFAGGDGARPRCDPASLQLDGNGAFPVPPEGVLYAFAFVNTGSVPCTLAGFPTIGVVYPNGTRPTLTQTDAAGAGGIYATEPTGPITLGPGDLAGFYVIVQTATSDTPGCAPAGETLRAIPPAARRGQVLSLPHSRLNYCPGDQVLVSPVHPGDAWPSPPPPSP